VEAVQSGAFGEIVIRRTAVVEWPAGVSRDE